MSKRLFALLAAFILVAFTVIPAFAAIDTTVSGTVLSIDEVAGTFQIGTPAGETLTVTVPAGFDFSTLLVGDIVEVQGSLEGTDLTAITVTPVVEDGEFEGKVNKGFYCTNPDAVHHGLDKLATEYGVSYADLTELFCNNHHGVGEIMLALQASQGEGAPSAVDLLDMKDELGGWGKVWQELGLSHGHGHDSGDDDSEIGDEDSDDENDQSGENNGQNDEEHGNGQNNEEHGNGNNGEHGNGNGKGHGKGNGH